MRSCPGGGHGLQHGQLEGALSLVPAAGESAPQGRSAIGWRVGVFWTGDQAFYYGEITAFEASTGQYTVVYTDGAACLRGQL